MDLSAVGDLLPPSLYRAARRPVVRYRFWGLRRADALLVSYPKSGSTWLRFLLAHALTGHDADFDSIRETVPPVGGHRKAPALLPNRGRLVRSHESLRHYQGRRGQRIIYLVRDGRDVAVSYLAHQRRNGRFTGDVAAFTDLFLEGRLDGYAPWPVHVLSAFDLAAAKEAPFLTVRYEDLRRHTVPELVRILTFLEAEADEAELRNVVACNTKERMRAKEGASTYLASQRSNGTPLVRPDDREGWSELVPPPLRERFERICGPALIAAGYEPSIENVIENVTSLGEA